MMNGITILVLVVVVAAVQGQGQGGGRGGGGGGGRGPPNRCRAEITYDDKGIIQWPSAKIGDTKTRPCPYDRRQADSGEESDDDMTNATMVTRECLDDNGPMWGPANTSECTPDSQVSRGNRLNHLRGTFIPPGQAKKVADALSELTADANGLEEDDLTSAVDVYDNILESSENGTDRDTLKSAMKGIGNIMKARPETLRASQKNNRGTARLLEFIEGISRRVDLENSTGTVNIVEDGINVFVTAIEDAQNFDGLAFSPEADGGETGDSSPPKVKIELPDTLFDKVDADRLGSIDRIHCTYYENGVLFQSGDEEESEDVGAVIAASVGDTPIQDLTDPVSIDFGEKEGDYECAFWDFTKKDGNGGWSKEGCERASTDVGIRCECNHLTNFALVQNSGSSSQQAAFGASLFGVLMSLLLVYLY